jgi:hypothetical protein
MVAPASMYQQQPPQSPSPPGGGGGGTSKIVPIVVSAGLAVGVFAGLLFGVGTGEVSAAAPRRIAADGSVIPVFEVGTEEFSGTERVAAVIDAGPPPVIDAGPPVDAAPAIKLARVTFEIQPPGASAKITIDGKEVEGGAAEFDITAGPKTVEVIIKAPGFRDYKKKIEITEDETQTVELAKRPAGGSTGNTGRPPRNNNNNNGRIDI